MRTAAVIAVTIFLAGMLLGCGTASREIQQKSQSGRTDVFAELKNGGGIPPGFSELTIKGNIKTHIEGYYILESKESLHGKEKYPFLINIDGQAAQWEVNGIKDIKPAYGADGKASRDPEAREGIKYILEKKIRLASGSHKIFFGLPEDKYFIEVEVATTEGQENILEFKPVYRYKTHPTRIPTFFKGINKYEVFLNSKRII